MSSNIREYVNFKRGESTELQCSETSGNRFEKRMPGDKETHNIINSDRWCFLCGHHLRNLHVKDIELKKMSMTICQSTDFHF